MTQDVPTDAQRGDRLTAAQVRQMAKGGEWWKYLEAVSPLYADPIPNGVRIRYSPDIEQKKKSSAVGLRWAWINSIPHRYFVTGTFLKPDADYKWSADGGSRPLFMPPNFVSTDLAKLASANWVSTTNDKTAAVLCLQIAGVWYVVWFPRWVVRDLPEGAKQVRCP